MTFLGGPVCKQQKMSLAERVVDVHRAHKEEAQRAIRSAARGGRLQGLRRALKSPASLDRKIREKRLRTVGEVRSAVFDVLRFTVTFPETAYAARAYRMLAQLVARAHWKIVRFRNFWRCGDGYNGINCVLKTDRGIHVEVQIHTPQSYAKKRATHRSYKRGARVSAAFVDGDSPCDRLDVLRVGADLVAHGHLQAARHVVV